MARLLGELPDLLFEFSARSTRGSSSETAQDVVPAGPLIGEFPASISPVWPGGLSPRGGDWIHLHPAHRSHPTRDRDDSVALSFIKAEVWEADLD